MDIPLFFLWSVSIEIIEIIELFRCLSRKKIIQKVERFQVLLKNPKKQYIPIFLWFLIWSNNYDFYNTGVACLIVSTRTSVPLSLLGDTWTLATFFFVYNFNSSPFITLTPTSDIIRSTSYRLANWIISSVYLDPPRLLSRPPFRPADPRTSKRLKRGGKVNLH